MKIKGLFAGVRRLVDGPPKSCWLDCAMQIKVAHSQGHRVQAMQMAEAARKRHAPEESAHYRAFLNNVALLYGESGRSDLAIAAASEALVLSRKLYPAAHPSVVDTELSLAIAYMYAGDANSAVSLLVAARASTKGDAFADPGLALRVLRTLGSAYGMQGNTEGEVSSAAEAYTRAVEQKTPPAELTFFQTEWGLALLSQRKLAEGFRLLEAAYMTRRNAPSADGYGVAAAAHNLGWAHEQLERWDAAVEFYDQAFQWRALNLGAGHAATVRSHAGLLRSEERAAAAR